MQIISKIEVSYFRSIYSVTLSPCRDINLFIGGNDAGKSNVLKSLNLFFNNETDLNVSYNFITDITKFRAKEASDAKGRASIWMKITFNNIFNWKSLPSQITIKKSWNRYNPEPEITFYPQIHNNKKILTQNISKFLNKIKFYYVPAIRSRHIYSYYLGMLHDALLDDTKIGMSSSTEQFTRTINEAVNDMSLQIKEKLGFQSTIQTPQDFRELFEALDFSTRFGNFDIPLQNRGDGIQARHIPFILDFIAKKSDKHHIWAYEEPENSLELLRAFDLAKQFSNDFSKENQIFLTTHSPAFYDLSGKRVSKWLVQSMPYKETSNQTTQVRILQDNGEPDIHLGIAELVKGRAKEIYEEREKLNKSVLQLKGMIVAYEKPVLVTEGKTDATIIKTAWEKLYPNESMFFDIFSCNVAAIEEKSECAGVKLLAQYLDSVLLNERNVRIGIFDRDDAGIRYYNSLSYFGNKDEHGIKKHKNGKSYAILLPKIEENLQEYWDTKNCPIEFLFKKEFLSGSYVKTIFSNNGKEISQRQAEEVQRSPLLHSLFDKSYKIVHKKQFAENKVPSFPAEAFINFIPLFNAIRRINSS